MASVLKSTRRSRRGKTFILCLAAGVMLSGSAHAQSQGQGQQSCIVKRAADAAVQRQIALIDAAKVNPSEFFNGPHSCIATNLLDRFDLSNLIPDLTGMLTSGITTMIQQAINKAKQQVCDILDDQLRNMIRKVNQNISRFESSIGNDLFGQLNGSISPIELPRIEGLGRYSYVTNATSGSALPNYSPVTAAPQQPVQSAAPSQTTPQTETPASTFRGIYQ